MKTLAELQEKCTALGIKVEVERRASKEPYLGALRDYHWRKDHPDEAIPLQVTPMLLSSWDDLDEAEAAKIEQDCHAWIVQPKSDGVRALLHIDGNRVRITGRTASEVSFRLSEFQDNLPHLKDDLSTLSGTILDGELVCPVSQLDTGTTVTTTSLQATMAVLAASPNKARQFQEGQNAHVRFRVFDILRFRGQDVTPLPLMDRQALLAMAVQSTSNEFVESVPSFAVNKPDIHRRVIDAGGEGTVWKKADAPYEPGRRVSHWIKRKQELEVEAVVTGFKAGTNGHTGLVGAVEFGIRQSDGSTLAIAWVSGFSDSDRFLLTDLGPNGEVKIPDRILGRRAIVAGQNRSARANRLRHARIVRWIDSIDVRAV